MAKALTCSLHIIIGDADPVPLESITPEQRTTWLRNASERLSRNMSAYYTQHPDEYRELIKEGM